MKASLSRMLRSGIAMLIVLCMVAAVIPAAVFANDAKKQEALGKLEETLDKAESNLNTLYGLIKTYGPKVAKDVWAQWEEYGYVDGVIESVATLKDMAMDHYDTYEAIALRLNGELQELVSTKDALTAELAVLNAQLATKKAQLDAILSQVGSVTAPDLNIDVDMGEHVGTPDHDCTIGNECVKIELEAAIADLEHAIAVLEALIADVETDIANMIALGNEIGETVVSLGTTIGQIAAAAADLKVAFEEIADVMTSDANVTAEMFENAFEAARASALAAIDVLNVTAEAASVAIADIEVMINAVIADLEAHSGKLVADLLKCASKLPVEVKEQLVVIIVAINNPADAKKFVAEELAKVRAEYSDEIAAAELELQKLLAKIDAEIAAKYPVVEAQLKAEAAAQIAALEAKKAALEAELKGYVEDLKNLPADAAQAVRDQLQAQIDRVTGDLAIVDADIAHAVAHLDAALKIAHREIVEEIYALHAEAVAQLEKTISDLKAALNAAMNKSLDELLVLGAQGLSGILDLLKGLDEDLAAMTEEALIALANELIELFNQMLYNATHGDVLVGVDMKYVALGDGTAAATGYVEILAELLAGNAPANFDFINAANAGNTVADVAANLPADVAGADLITLGFGQTELIGQALASAINGEEVDWVALLGEEAVPYVNEALEYVYGEIDAMNLDETTATIVKAIAEAYAYGVAEYAVNLPVLIKNIREINKTAEIVIVGMHNPLANAVIEIPLAGKIDLSAYTEIFNYLIDGVYCYGVGLSVIAQDVTYVDAREVEVEKAVLSLLDVDTLIKGDISALYPSANGDAYIAEQIANALTIQMKGDANGDGVVDSYDATLIARYDVGLIGANGLNLSVCDLNGDGVVDSYDATLVARYDVGLLAA